MATKSPWPVWLKNQIPSWLESTGYPAPGVGDLQDCKHHIGVGSDGSWISFVNKGWYYYNNREQYQYVIPKQTTFVTNTGSGSYTDSVSLRPTWGPVLLTSDASGGPYTQHASCFWPGQVFQWTQITGTTFFYTTLPTGCVVTGARNFSTLPLGQVSASGAIIGSNLYYYDPSTQLVIINPASSGFINIYLDVLYTTPFLKFKELVVVEADGQTLTPSYKTFYGLANVECDRGNQVVSLGNIAGPTITNPLSGCVAGDWVVLQYNIPGSYVLINHQTLQLYSFPILSDTVTLTYETSLPDLIPAISLTGGPTNSLFNVNPVYTDGYRAGYLFHATLASSLNSYFQPRAIRGFFSKDYVVKDFNELVQYTLTVLGDNKLPLPYYPVSLSITNASVISTTATGTTDGKGEVNLTLSPTATGTISITATCSSFSNTASIQCVNLAAILDQNLMTDGFNHIVITKKQASDGGYICYAARTALDGVPVISTWANSLYIRTLLSSQLEGPNPSNATINYTASQSLQLITGTTLNLLTGHSLADVCGMSQFEYFPQKKDKIVATSTYGFGVIQDVGQ